MEKAASLPKYMNTHVIADNAVTTSLSDNVIVSHWSSSSFVSAKRLLAPLDLPEDISGTDWAMKRDDGNLNDGVLESVREGPSYRDGV